MTVDSAASGTAYHCGVKTKYEAVGVDDTVKRQDCDSVANATVTSVLDWALAAGYYLIQSLITRLFGLNHVIHRCYVKALIYISGFTGVLNRNIHVWFNFQS